MSKKNMITNYNNNSSNQNVLHIYLDWSVSPRVNCYTIINARPYQAIWKITIFKPKLCWHYGIHCLYEIYPLKYFSQYISICKHIPTVISFMLIFLYYLFVTSCFERVFVTVVALLTYLGQLYPLVLTLSYILTGWFGTTSQLHGCRKKHNINVLDKQTWSDLHTSGSHTCPWPLHCWVCT